MQNKNFFFLLLASIFFITSCKEDKGVSINGQIVNADQMSIALERIGVNNAQKTTLATVQSQDDGNFNIALPDPLDAGVYNLRIGSKVIEFLSDGTEKNYGINADLLTIQNGEYTLEGSALTSEYMDVLTKARSRELDVNQLRNLAMSEAHPLVAYMVATRMFTFRDDFADVHDSVLSRLQKEMPDLYLLNDYNTIVGQLKKAKARKEATAKIKVGMQAPDIALPMPDGGIKKLSDYKGKIVLLDFWASWCRPCRKANPKVVEVYNKYKDQGFDVFSVSLDGLDNRTRARLNDKTQIQMNLDRQKERWIAAIQQDQLTWDGHVSDLKKWDSEASALYGVTGIPKTFLIDRDGKIAAIDPRYNLEETLRKFI